MSTEKMKDIMIRTLFYVFVLGTTYIILEYAFPFITPFIIAFTIAFILQPIIRFLKRTTNMSRVFISVMLLILVIIIVFTLLVYIIVNIYSNTTEFVSQLPQFYTETISPVLTTFSNNLETFLSNVSPEVSQLVGGASEALGSAVSSLLSEISGGVLSFATTTATGVPMFIVQFVLAIVATFFCIIDYDTIVGFVFNRLPLEKRKTVLLIKNRSLQVLGEYLRAYAILLSITCVELFIGFLLLGVENALPLAGLIAIVDILPILGVGTVLIPWGIIMILAGNIPFGIGILILYAIITIVRQSLEPKVIGKRIGLHPFVTLFCIFLGGNLFGILGIFGLPIAVTVITQLNRSGEIKLF